MAKSTANDELQTLREENVRLMRENESLRSQMNTAARSKGRRTHHFWRAFTSAAMISLAGALLVAGNLLFWAGNTIINTDKYMAVVTPIIQNKEVQTALAQYTTDQLFSTVDVQQIIQDSLPPKAEFLAPTLSSQVEKSTLAALEKVLANEKFQDVWINGMRMSHEKLLAYVRSYEGNGTISLQDVYQQATAGLSDTKLAFLADKQLPAKVGSITVAEASWLPAAHTIVVNIGLYQALTTLLFLALSIGAIWVSSNRRRTTITLGVMFAAFMLVTLIGIRIMNMAIVNSIDTQYQPAVQEIVNALTQSLVVATRTILLLGVLTVIIAWMSGPYPAAAAIRRRSQLFLGGNVHGALFSHGENRFTLWIGAHKRILQWVLVILIAVIMLLVTLSPALVLVYALLMLVAVVVVELLAARR